MKKIFFSIIAAAAIFTGCNTSVIEQRGTGSLSVDLSCKSDLHEVQSKAAATDEEIINNLVIDIQRPYDNWKTSFDPFSSIRGKVVELGSGDYILTASSPSKEHVAYEQPIYEGSKDFKILTGQVTTIDVICAITNVKVTVNLSDNFVKELSDYTVTVSNGKGMLLWNKNAQENDFRPVVIDAQTYYTCNQAGFFTVAPLSVRIDGHRAIDNSSASTTTYIDNVKAADHHILNIDAKVTGQIGNISITINHQVNEIDQPITVPGFDEIPVPGDDPSTGDGDDTGNEGSGDDNTGNDNTGGEVEQPVAVIVWDANPTYADMLINADMNADMVISVPGKIAEFEVTVDSPQLTAAIEGLTSDGSAKMDLINDAGLIAFLAEAAPALPTGSNLSGKTQVDFFLTEFIEMISIFGPASGDRHNFTLEIKDEAGKTFSKTLTFVTE